MKQAEVVALSQIEEVLSTAKTFQKIKRNVRILSKRLKRSTRGDIITCDKVKNPPEQRVFQNNEASEIISPLAVILQKYSKCARFGDYQNRLERLENSLLKALRKFKWVQDRKSQDNAVNKILLIKNLLSLIFECFRYQDRKLWRSMRTNMCSNWLKSV